MKKRVLVIYFSFTQQTRILVKKFGDGLEEQGHLVSYERLLPKCPYEFPMQTNLRLISIMLRTFFRERLEIEPVSENCYDNWDYIVLGGPTWSYHPSGPVLSLLDQFGAALFGGKTVIPIISCRSYWRLHFWSVRRKLQRLGSKVLSPIIFEHPAKEPYGVIGLCLHLRGKTLRSRWFRKNYPHYGNSKEQGEMAYQYGLRYAKEWSEEGKETKL